GGGAGVPGPHRPAGQGARRAHRAGEVEAVLGEHPGVREVAVVARQDAGEARLAAYVVPRAPGAGLQIDFPAILREHLRGRLPEAMMPAAWVVLDALPLTPNGKVDRKALPAPSFAPEQRRTAPRTPAEALLTGIFEELLGTGELGVE